MSDADPQPRSWPFLEAQRRPASGALAERRRLAAGMRRVIEGLVVTDAPLERLRSAADRLHELADVLEDLPRAAKLEGYAESANSGDVHAFFDRSPLIGLSNPMAPPIWLGTEGERTKGLVVFGSAYEGPPGHLHGGFVAAAFDEVLGFAQSVTGNPGMTARLIVHYRRPTPLHTELHFDAGVDRVEGRKIFASGCMRADGEVTAEAEALFISIDRARYESMVAAKAECERGRG